MIPWKDPREWMEDMSSQRWWDRVEQENRRFSVAVARTAKKVVSNSFSNVVDSFRSAQAYLNRARVMRVQLGTQRLTIVPQPGGSFLWGFEGRELKKDPVGDIDIDLSNYIVTSVDIGKGAEKYEIRGHRNGHHVWTYRGPKDGLSSYVAIMKGRVYCLEAESPLRYTRLVSLDLSSGKKREFHYEERNRSTALSLVKGSLHCLFLLLEDAGRQTLYWIGPGGLQHICPGAACVVPIGYMDSRSRRPYCLARVGSFAAPWSLWSSRGQEKGFRIPSELSHCGVEAICVRSKMVVLKDMGIRRCVKYSTGSDFYSFLGEVEENPWSAWLNGSTDMKVSIPGYLPFQFTTRPAISPYAGNLHHGIAKSADGTPVRWIRVSSDKRPVGLIVVVYGAYGISTYLDTARWIPFLDAGFAIGYALVRGGGDDGELWAEAGRREGKLKGIEDTEACIRSLQDLTGCGPSRTCLYGRSAGGYMVGAVVSRHPAGDLVGVAYTEVPYVDVLKTAANTSLPLTEYEYLEFGDPLHSIADFKTLLQLSPIHSLGEKGAPGVSVLTRTGMNDMQVLAYESVKWVDALRSKGGKEKIVFVNKGAGHFTRGGSEFIERAEDFCWILEKILS